MGLQRYTKKVPPKPPLFERIPLEATRGQDGRPIRPGHVVRRAARVGSMGVEVATVTGTVVAVYRRQLDGPDLVDFRAPARHGGGLHTARAEHLRRSQASQA